MINSKNKKMYIYLLVMAILLAAGFQGWRTIFNNFAVEAVNINGQQMGIIQSVREIPGLLALLVVYLLLILKEHRLAAASLLVFGLGVGLTGYLDSFWGLVITTLIMSFGFHYYETVNQSLTLQYFCKTTAPLVLSKIKSIGAGTNILIGGIIYLAAAYLSYKQIFLIVGLFVIAGALWCLFQNPTNENIVPQHKKMILRKKYWLFYALTMLSGARRQIFVAFAVFLLVKKMNFSVQEITILFVINNVIAYLFLPYVGKAINKFGEKTVLSAEYISLIFVFMIYAFSTSKLLTGFTYIWDHMVFSFSIAINSYFQKTSDPADIAPSMAVGFTINHIVAVVLPFVGGALWMIDYKIPFFIGVGLAVASLTLSQFINTNKNEPEIELSPSQAR